MRGSGRILLLLVALGGLGALAAREQAGREAAERREGVETSRTRAWARANTAAGVSVLPKRVPAADRRELRRLEALPGFHEYAMRCSSCHALPNPAAYAPREWVGKVAEMERVIERASVMPPPPGELDAAADFLGAAADSLRGG